MSTETCYMDCRAGCGACCIGPSISPCEPVFPSGKKAGERCAYLNENYLCSLFNSPDRPSVCGGFQAELLFCGKTREEALAIFAALERGSD